MERHRQGGYSLIEVLVATAITAVVLLTVSTLFYMGSRNVYSGKQRTQAVAVGTQMLEDLSTMTSGDIQTNFGITDATALGTVSLTNVARGTPGESGGTLQFPGSVTYDTSGCTASGTPVVWSCGASDPNGYLAKWLTLVADPATADRSQKLTNAQIGIVITPRNPTDNAKPWTTAQFTRVRAYVRWDESNSKSHKFAFFDTSKVMRQ